MTHEDVEPTDTRTITAAPDVYEQLNREYFMGSPLDYFTQRLDGLLNLAAAHPDYTERLRTGIARAGTKIHVPAANVAPTQLDGKKLLAYIVTDSIILHQHAVESLFLAILPELHGSGCPWLEVAGKDARELAADVQRLLDWDAGGRTDALIDVFTRRAATAPPDGFTVDQWAKQAHDLNSWIEDLGRRFLDDRQIYNAAKHGLGVRAAGWELRAGANQDELHQLLNGPAIAYLAHGGWQNHRREWSRYQRWIDLVDLWSSTLVAAHLLDTCWRIARFRLLDHDDRTLWLPTEPPTDRSSDIGLGAQRAQMKLAVVAVEMFKRPRQNR